MQFKPTLTGICKAKNVSTRDPQSDRIVAVTGAADGIGLGIARHFAKSGAVVVMMDNQAERLESSAQALRDEGLRADAAVVDIADPESVAATFEQIGRDRGHLDILVNNAGLGSALAATTMPLDHWNRVMAVNLTGPFITSRAAYPLLCAGSGKAIVNIASLGALVSSPSAAAYSASKSGLLGLTRSLALEWAAAGIRVNAICPGVIDAGLAIASRERDPAAFERRVQRIPLKRVVSIDEIAEAVAYLAGAPSITGTNLVIDGGSLALHSGYDAA